MKPRNTILIGDAIEQMAGLPERSVHCCVTSPPYYGLRDYGTASWHGGDAQCDHLGQPMKTKANINKNCGTGKDVKNAIAREPMGQTCSKCGATRIDQQIGLEETPEQYIERLVDVFRAVRRVLRDDGTLWMNIGDSYNGSGGIGGKGKQHTNKGSASRPDARAGYGAGYKPKDLMMMPARLAIALQVDGWYLRQDIIWHKPNPMPESVRDRCTKAHEYIFLLTKRASYYYDADAIRERPSGISGGASFGKVNHDGPGSRHMENGQADRAALDARGANKRSVWAINTQAYPEAHFATFPLEIPMTCIRAATSERGCCPACGAQWIRQTKTSRFFESGSGRSGKMPAGKNGAGMQGGGETKDIRRGPTIARTTTGWRPACRCAIGDTDEPHEPVPCLVFDPFTGSGTTGEAANLLGHHFVGTELNPEYAALAKRRIARAMRPSTAVVDAIAEAPLFRT